MTAVLLAFVVIGVAMPVLPLHVHGGLGLSTFIRRTRGGGAVCGGAVWSGRYADQQGAKAAVLVGLLAATGAGLLYLPSLRFTTYPLLSVVVLLLGRAVLGGAESFIITGATIWGLAGVGSHHAGKVIALVGTAMFAGFAAEAPFGTTL